MINKHLIYLFDYLKIIFFIDLHHRNLNLNIENFFLEYDLFLLDISPIKKLIDELKIAIDFPANGFYYNKINNNILHRFFSFFKISKKTSFIFNLFTFKSNFFMNYFFIFKNQCFLPFLNQFYFYCSYFFNIYFFNFFKNFYFFFSYFSNYFYFINNHSFNFVKKLNNSLIFFKSTFFFDFLNDFATQYFLMRMDHFFLLNNFSNSIFGLKPSSLSNF